MSASKKDSITDYPYTEWSPNMVNYQKTLWEMDHDGLLNEIRSIDNAYETIDGSERRLKMKAIQDELQKRNLSMTTKSQGLIKITAGHVSRLMEN